MTEVMGEEVHALTLYSLATNADVTVLCFGLWSTAR